jgi:hypothetical protein
MLQAQLKGKLTREEQNLEDLLTSNVFGSFKYVSAEDGILPLLLNCQNDKGKPILTEKQIVEQVEYEFWPRLKELKDRECEPDVLITINFDF